VVVSDIDVATDADQCELRANLRFDTHWVWGDEPFPLWYRFPVAYREYLRADNGDPFAAACLALAMVLGEPLGIEAPVSAKLARAVHRLQTTYRFWYPELHVTALQAPIRPQPTETPGASGSVGLFYSLGADSSYCLLKNAEEPGPDDKSVTHLLPVDGFDVYLWEEGRFAPLLDGVCRAAEGFGKEVLPAATNLREVGDRVADWPRLHHGAALASVALALGRFFRQAYVAASGTYARLVPWGSHPLTDPLWSTESLLFVHDGLEATRLTKLRYVSRCPTILANLRVCTTGEVTHAYNCGECEKCLRTMIGLHIAGALERCPTLPHRIDPGRVRQLQVANPFARGYLQELRDALGSTGEDEAIRSALTDCLSRAPLADSAPCSPEGT
jgi:hypothetical protein